MSDKKYLLKDVTHGDIVTWTVKEILDEINRDRSEEWTPYDENDWMEGLTLTDYEVLKELP